MTPLEMNMKIAEIMKIRKEFCYLKANRKTGILYACDVVGYVPSEECVVIDYTTDKALFCDLMEMLGPAGWKYSFNWQHEWVKRDIRDNSILCRVLNESLLLATCLAFLEEFSNGKE